MTDDIIGPAAETLRALEQFLAEMPPDLQDSILAYKAAIEGAAVSLREAGWTQGQVGALLFDNFLNVQKLDHQVAVALIMVVLR